MPRLRVLVALVAMLGSAGAAAVVRPARHDETIATPSDADVRTLLLAKWQQALRQGKTAYCADVQNPAGCSDQWEAAGGDAAVPHGEPRVVATHEAAGVRWLTICGTTGDGHKYAGEFAANRNLHDGPVVIIHPVFWGGLRFRGAFVEGSEPTTTVPYDYPDLC